MPLPFDRPVLRTPEPEMTTFVPRTRFLPAVTFTRDPIRPAVGRDHLRRDRQGEAHLGLRRRLHHRLRAQEASPEPEPR